MVVSRVGLNLDDTDRAYRDAPSSFALVSEHSIHEGLNQLGVESQ